MIKNVSLIKRRSFKSGTLSKQETVQVDVPENATDKEIKDAAALIVFNEYAQRDLRMTFLTVKSAREYFGSSFKISVKDIEIL